MEIGWGIATVWMGLALLASFISIRFKLSVALVEILVGAAAVAGSWRMTLGRFTSVWSRTRRFVCGG